MTDLPANLSFASLFAYLYRAHGAEAFALFLEEVNQLDGRYGDVFTLERQKETLAELRTMGLDAVANAIEASLPHEWQVQHPYNDRVWDDDRPRLVKEWQAKMDAKRKAFEAKNSPQVLGTTPPNAWGVVG